MVKICLVILAAGISSRYGGFPKQLVKIGPKNETLIEYSVDQALHSPFSQIHFIISEKTKFIQTIFGKNYHEIPVTYSMQTFDKNTQSSTNSRQSLVRKKPWGTTDAITTIKGHVTTPFIVCNGDDIYGELTFKDCFNCMEKLGGNITMGFWLGDTMPRMGKVNRGVMHIDPHGFMEDLTEKIGIEKRNLSSIVLENTITSVNFFGFQPDVIDMLVQKNNKFKTKHKDNQTIEHLMPTTVNELVQENKIKVRILMSRDKWYGITNPGDEIVVRNQLKSRIF
uniref:MobA-like NTP transferase domain protein n=1 Tax=Mimivirus LCMiAC01 TaxID=2506608 RepID=A0A481Z152_9VIRU|nr:MAG: MobA-like NTP transferase domain protein [Mimivirus LCMiAC01]